MPMSSKSPPAAQWSLSSFKFHMVGRGLTSLPEGSSGTSNPTSPKVTTASPHLESDNSHIVLGSTWTFLPANPAKQVDGHISLVKCHFHDRNHSVGPCDFLSNERHLAPALPLLPVSFNPCSTLELKRPFQNFGRIMSPSYSKPFSGILQTKDDVQAPRCAPQGTVASFLLLLPLSVQCIFLFLNEQVFLSTLGLACTVSFPSHS